MPWNESGSGPCYLPWVTDESFSCILLFLQMCNCSFSKGATVLSLLLFRSAFNHNNNDKINICTSRKSHLPQMASPDLSKKTSHSSVLSSSDYMTRKSNFNIKKIYLVFQVCVLYETQSRHNVRELSGSFGSNWVHSKEIRAVVWDVWPLSCRGLPAALWLALKQIVNCSGYSAPPRICQNQLEGALKNFHYHTQNVRENKQRRDIDERHLEKERYLVYYHWVSNYLIELLFKRKLHRVQFHLIISLKHRGQSHLSIVYSVHFTCENGRQETKLVSTDGLKNVP